MPAQKIICETTKSLKICYLFNISQERVHHTKISDVDELKRRINSEWVARLLNVLFGEWCSVCALVFVLEADILSYAVIKMM